MVVWIRLSSKGWERAEKIQKIYILQIKILAQYKKRIGQRVSILTFDGLKHTGLLIAADENQIEINEEIKIGSGKKKEIQTKQYKIPLTEIKETRVIFSFDKII